MKTSKMISMMLTIGLTASLLVALVFAKVDHQDILVDRVDLCEINHFYDDKGWLVFDQVIFYDWSPNKKRYQVVDWRLLKSSSQRPIKDWRNNEYVAVWHDPRERDVLRKTISLLFRETWTQYDPELLERDSLSLDDRRELSKVEKPEPSSKQGGRYDGGTRRPR